MTIAALKRKYPRLIRQAERSMRLKFKRKPILRISKGGRPRDECEREREGNRKITKVTLARITIPKRMAKENPKVAELAALHELRENLAFQNGYSITRSHRTACKREHGDRARLGLKKHSGWLFRDHYHWKRDEDPLRKLAISF